MSIYWNKICLRKLMKAATNKQVKYKIKTDIGRFYFYFEKDGDSDDGTNITGKMVFFPDTTK